MCKTTLTHYNCRCTHLVVHSCALDFPLGRLVCPPPHLLKKDIYAYADCEDCVAGAREREIRAAKKMSEIWMMVEEVLEAESGEVKEVYMDEEKGDGDKKGEVKEEEEVYGEEMEKKYNAMMNRAKSMRRSDMHMDIDENLSSPSNSDEDMDLEKTQRDIQSEIEESDQSPTENDDIAAAAQLLSALNQELGYSGSGINAAGGGNENEGEDKEYAEHVQTIMENLGKLKEGRRSRREVRREMQGVVDAMDIEQEEDA